MKYKINWFNLIYLLVLIFLIICVLIDFLTGNFFNCIKTSAYQVHICNYSWYHFGLYLLFPIWCMLTIYSLFQCFVFEEKNDEEIQ